jgi:RNA polymerase sigma factor (sigma-70 family)
MAVKGLVVQALEHEKLLSAVLHRYTGNVADVEELLQETYLRLHRVAPAEWASIRCVRAYACTIARNVALDWRRHRSVVPIDLVEDMESLETADEAPSPEKEADDAQLLEQILTAIAQLPPKCRQVVVLRKVYEFSQKEIAERLQISEHTVHEHVRKALSAIRRCLCPAEGASQSSSCRQPEPKDAPAEEEASS